MDTCSPVSFIVSQLVSETLRKPREFLELLHWYCVNEYAWADQRSAY